MVEDYHNRKMAKKKRKREGQAERPEGKRVRSKKNKTRRICRGLCYKDPFEVRRKGQPSADAQVAAVEESHTDDSAAPPKPKRRRRQKPEASVKQSTSINLLASAQHDGVTLAAKPYQGAADALLGYHESIQQYMLDQGLTGPTPVQERYTATRRHQTSPRAGIFMFLKSAMTAGVGRHALRAKMSRQLQSLAVAKRLPIFSLAYHSCTSRLKSQMTLTAWSAALPCLF